MDINLYKRLNEINGLNALDYPDIVYGNEYLMEVIECAIRRHRSDILNMLDIKDGMIKIEWYAYCDDISTLESIAQYITFDDNVIKEIVIADNLTAINLFNICLDFYIDIIEAYIPAKIIKQIVSTTSLLSHERAFTQALLLNNYEVCTLLIDYINKSNTVKWETILRCENSNIVNLCMDKLNLPKRPSKSMMISAIENGHLRFVTAFPIKSKYSPELLYKLISQNRFDLVIQFQQLNIFNNQVSEYLYVTNLFGYTYYRNMEGFDHEAILHEIISDGRYELIKSISDDYSIMPSIDYLALALGSNCPITLLAVLNHLVTKEQIVSSINLTVNQITVLNRLCYIVYLRVCFSIGILPNYQSIHETAIKFDSPTIIKFIPYDQQLTLYDSIMNVCPRIFKLCYQPDLIVPDMVLVNGYINSAKNNNLTFLAMLASKYIIPNNYENKYGGRGTKQMINDLRYK